MKNGLKLAIIAFLLSALPLSASNYDLITELGSSAKTIGLGDVRGYNNSSSVIFENPAGLDRLEKYSMSAFRTQLFDEVSYLNLSGAYKYRSHVFAFGYMNTGVNSIPVTAEENTVAKKHIEIDSFNYKSSVMKLGYSRKAYKDIHMGVAYNYFGSKIYTNTAKGHSLDFGARMPYKRFEFMASAENLLGTKVKYSNGGEEKLSRIFRGSAKTHIFGLDTFTQLSYRQKVLLYSLGLEYTPSFFKYMTLRTGYRTSAVIEKSVGSATFGIGINLFNLHFDYALETSDMIDSSYNHYFSLNLTHKKQTEKDKDLTQGIVYDSDGFEPDILEEELEQEVDKQFALLHTPIIEKEQLPAPRIELDMPTETWISGGRNSMVLRGRVYNASTFKINGVEVYVRPNDNLFFTKLKITQENMLINLKATNRDKVSVLVQKVLDQPSIERTVTIQADQPSIQLDMENETWNVDGRSFIAMRGFVYNASTFSINGTRVYVRPDNKFFFKLKITSDPMPIAMIAVHKSGKETVINKLLGVGRAQVTPKATTNTDPQIILDMQSESWTKEGRDYILIKGNVANTKTLYLNGNPIWVRPSDQAFIMTLPLNDGDTPVDFRAVGPRGHETTLSKVVKGSPTSSTPPQQTALEKPIINITMNDSDWTVGNKSVIALKGTVKQAKAFYINNKQVYVRPADNKFFVKFPLQGPETTFEFKAIHSNGSETIINKTASRSLKQRQTSAPSKPRIILSMDNETWQADNRSAMAITGKVFNAKALFINGEQVYVRPDNKFYKKIKVSGIGMPIEIKAVHSSGKETKIKRTLR